MAAESRIAPLRLLVADDHPATLAGTVASLAEAPDIEVAGQAADTAETLHLAQALQPDVILLDARMPGLSPAELVRRLRTVCPQGRVLVLSAYREPALVLGMLRAGAAGYLVKEEDLETIAAAVRGVARGETRLSPQIAALVTRQAVMGEGGPSLTAREREVLALLVVGKGTQEIAAALSVTPKTVGNHISNVLRKADVTSRTELVACALGAGWLDLE